MSRISFYLQTKGESEGRGQTSVRISMEQLITMIYSVNSRPSAISLYFLKPFPPQRPPVCQHLIILANAFSFAICPEMLSQITALNSTFCVSFITGVLHPSGFHSAHPSPPPPRHVLPSNHGPNHRKRLIRPTHPAAPCRRPALA